MPQREQHQMSTRFIVLLIQRSAGLMLILIGSAYILQPSLSAAPVWIEITGIEQAAILYAAFLLITGFFAMMADVTKPREAMLVAAPIWLHTGTVSYYIIASGELVSLALYTFINIMLMVFIRYHFQRRLVFHEAKIQRMDYIIDLTLDVLILTLRQQLIKEVDKAHRA